MKKKLKTVHNLKQKRKIITVLQDTKEKTTRRETNRGDDFYEIGIEIILVPVRKY